MSGGGSSGTTYQQSNSNSSSGPPTAIAWMLNDIAGQRYGQYQQNPNAPAYYPGQTVAPFSTDTNAGLTALFNRGANGSPVQTAGQGVATDTLAGKYLDLNNNPYFQGALKAGFDTQTKSFLDNVLPSLRSQFQGAGRTGSGADFDTAMRATSDLSRAQASAAAGAAADTYAKERGFQNSTLGMLPSFQAADYQNAQAMLQSGALRDAKTQQNIDADVAKYNYEQNAQGDYATRVAQQIQSIYPGGTTTGNSFSTGMMQQPGMGTGGWIGAGMGAAGLALQALPLLGISDRRDKTDIKELGIDPLTGRKMYAYRYKGDPKSYPKVVGPMAQDLEKAGAPVREIGGHKVVPMEYLRPPTGGLM